MRFALVLLLFLAAACSQANPSVPTPVAWQPPSYSGLNLSSLGTYATTFEVRFQGTYDWTYRLETHSDGDVVEYRLHLEGLGSSRNPGDVRLVREGDVSRMRGPGTDDECLQFPSDLDLGLSFLTPDDLIDLRGVQQPLAPRGVEDVAGRTVTHYVLSQKQLGDWQDVRAELWLDHVNDAVLRYELRIKGQDPLFDAGEGVLTGQFAVSDTGPQAIEPIAGCDLELPLPADAERLTRLPDLIAFESQLSPTEVGAFYQAALAEAGWEAVEEPEASADAVVLSFRRAAQTLEINVEQKSRGVHVELLFNQEE